jgi:hypothetical protein
VGSWFRRHGWWIFFLLGIGAVLAAPIELLGRPPDPPSAEGITGLSLDEIGERVPGIPRFISSISRQLGNFMLTSGVLMAAIAAIPFRKGERWAWWAMWTAPLLLLIQFVNSNFGSGWWADLGLVPVTLAALLAPYRKFFPKRGGST